MSVFLVAWETLSFLAPLTLRYHAWDIASIVGSFGIRGDLTGGAFLLISSAALTLLRTLVAFAIGLVIGTAFGALPFLLRQYDEIPIRIVSLFRLVPLFGLVPLWLFWFSGGSAAAIGYIAFAVSVLIAGALHDSTSAVPEIYIEQARLLGASRYETLLHVVLPALVRFTASTAAWISALLLPLSLGAEILDSDSGGVGKLVYNSYAYANLGQLLVLAAIYAASGALVTYITATLIDTVSAYHFS